MNNYFKLLFLGLITMGAMNQAMELVRAVKGRQVTKETLAAVSLQIWGPDNKEQEISFLARNKEFLKETIERCPFNKRYPVWTHPRKNPKNWVIILEPKKAKL